MMKKALVSTVFCAAAVLCALTGCGGSGKGTAKTVSGGYLPERIEQIQEGGMIPSGREAARQMEDAAYPEESLYGDWVRVYASGEEPLQYAPDVQTVQYPCYDEEGKEFELPFGCFPESMQFYPAGYGALSSSMARYELQREAEETGTVSVELSPFAQVAKVLGYGEGTVTLQDGETKDTNAMFQQMSYRGRGFVYAFSGSKLVMGYLDEAGSLFGGFDDSAITETNLFEMDYDVSFEGTVLTLTYGDQSAVYEPKCVAQEQKIKLDSAGLADGETPLDGILGITLDSSAGTGQVMYDIHDGYTDVPVTFLDNGTCTIAETSYRYLYSGDTLILQNESSSSSYCSYCPAVKSPGLAENSAFVVNGTEIAYDHDTVQRLTERGLQTDLDLNQLVGPRQVTDEFVMRLGSAQIRVRAANPYGQQIPLADCLVCAIVLDSSAGDVQKNGTFSFSANQTVEVGTTSYRTVEFLHLVPYEKKPGLLRYKAAGNGYLGTRMQGAEGQQKYGPYVLEPDQSADVIYEFDENNVLSTIRIEMPTLLYDGLQDNAPLDTLASMDAATLQGVMQARDTVLERLKAAFESAGVQVSINETSGEITLDSAVLFGFDSYELTEEGKAYLNSFTSVYASVLLDDSLNDVVTAICFDGHTDSSGSYYYNQTLSQKRAEAVRQWCMDSAEGSLTAAQNTRFEEISSATGYSCADPIYDETGKEDAAASRRVEIRFCVAD